jgi:hypothetical protein
MHDPFFSHRQPRPPSPPLSAFLSSKLSSKAPFGPGAVVGGSNL